MTHPHPSTPRFTARAAGVAACLALAVAAPTASAAPELVSRAGGDGSLPFPAQLAAASSDGRYVVLSLGTPNTRTEPTGPEAQINSPSGYVIRDRTAQTVSPLAIRTAEGGNLQATVLQISRDGLRLLVVDTDGKPYAIDRQTGQPLALPTTPGLVTNAELSDDGQSAVVSTTGTDVMNNPAKDNAIYRGPIGGAGSLVVKLYGVALADASDDLQTILYSRALPRVVNPKDAAKTFTGRAIGIKQGDGAPHVIAQSSYRQTLRTAEGSVCTPDATNIQTKSSDVLPVALSGDGGRAVWSVNRFDSDYYGLLNTGFSVRTAGGELREVRNAAPYLSPSFEAIARSHDDTLIPQVAFKDSPTRYRRIFVNDDRTVLTSDQGSGIGPGPQPTRYVTADGYEPFATPPAKTLSFTGDEPVDTDALKADVAWAECPAPETAPVGTYDDYAYLGLTKPLSSSATIGGFTFKAAPDGKRAATKVTVEVKPFGWFTTFKRTLTADGQVILPRPLPWIPLTVRVTVQPAAATTGGALPAPLVRQYSVLATR